MIRDIALSDTMPDHARVWVYKSDRILTSQEQEKVLSLSKQFLSDWNSHGSAMSASSDVLLGRFLVIIADEAAAKASGCSIDSQVHFVQGLGKELGVDFFDRMHVVYKDGETPAEIHFNEIPKALECGELNSETLVYDVLVSDFGALKTVFERPLGETWLERYL